MRSHTWILTIVVAAFIAAAAFAQTGKLGVGVHGSSVSSATEEGSRTFQWGIHARARISPFLGIEGSLDFRSEDIEDSTLKIYPIQFSALFYLLPQSRAGIYGLVGLGFTRTSTDGNLFSGEAVNSDFSYHYGFGLEIPFGRSSAVFVDARYLNLNLDISSLILPNLDSDGWQLNFGYSLYF